MWRHNSDLPIETREQNTVSWIPITSDFFVPKFVVIATLNLLGISYAQEGQGTSLTDYIDSFDPVASLVDESFLPKPKKVETTSEHMMQFQKHLDFLKQNIHISVAHALHKRMDIVYARTGISESTSWLPKDPILRAHERYDRLQNIYLQTLLENNATHKELSFLVENILRSTRTSLGRILRPSVVLCQKWPSGEDLYEIYERISNEGTISEIAKVKTQTQDFVSRPFVGSLLDTLLDIQKCLPLSLNSVEKVDFTQPHVRVGKGISLGLDDFGLDVKSEHLDTTLVANFQYQIPKGATNIQIDVFGDLDGKVVGGWKFVYVADVQIIGKKTRSKRGIRMYSGNQEVFHEGMNIAVDTRYDQGIIVSLDISGLEMVANDLGCNIQARD